MLFPHSCGTHTHKHAARATQTRWHMRRRWAKHEFDRPSTSGTDLPSNSSHHKPCSSRRSLTTQKINYKPRRIRETSGQLRARREPIPPKLKVFQFSLNPAPGRGMTSTSRTTHHSPGATTPLEERTDTDDYGGLIPIKK